MRRKSNARVMPITIACSSGDNPTSFDLGCSGKKERKFISRKVSTNVFIFFIILKI